MPATMDKVRMTIDMSPELSKTLEDLAASRGTSKAEIIRKAIVLAKVLNEAERTNKKFGIANPDQQLETEIVGL